MSRFSPFSRPPAPGFARPVAELLSRTEALAPLRAGVEQMTAMRRDLEALLPDYLATSVEPGFIKDGKLALFTAHNALAARLRQLEPRLVADLQARGWPLDSVRIRVRPQSVKEAKPPKEARMSPAGAEALRALSEELPPSPLQAALAKMAARHSNKR
ncbi:DciA family protein [Paraburkholderia adhaesiva]|uniref:DciA family protein n=1 Tax=Paraburkholderia adhaesiva TaxID=2883244 RepID=UPI001F1C6643|nr:DciA family protein [Paraburkholderia adhaesiva]